MEYIIPRSHKIIFKNGTILTENNIFDTDKFELNTGDIYDTPSFSYTFVNTNPQTFYVADFFICPYRKYWFAEEKPHRHSQEQPELLPYAFGFFTGIANLIDERNKDIYIPKTVQRVFYERTKYNTFIYDPEIHHKTFSLTDLEIKPPFKIHFGKFSADEFNKKEEYINIFDEYMNEIQSFPYNTLTKNRIYDIINT